jgi:hypothetical protein
MGVAATPDHSCFGLHNPKRDWRPRALERQLACTPYFLPRIRMIFKCKRRRKHWGALVFVSFDQGGCQLAVGDRTSHTRSGGWLEWGVVYNERGLQMTYYLSVYWTSINLQSTTTLVRSCLPREPCGVIRGRSRAIDHDRAAAGLAAFQLT